MNNKTKITVIFIAAAIIAFVLVATNKGADMNNYRHIRISASEAHKRMLANPGAVILDVRTAGEYATGRIPGAMLLPEDTIREMARTVLPNPNALIFVYCRSGIRSANAACTLMSMGYTNVLDCGGILDWPYDIER
ncbi:MAG: rhodanese-like domain-containing protein [Defluviitaleaceae bacterium]|nr:rhodanese-like domain-containing protein [Defluviitaleaceae bacterium]